MARRGPARRCGRSSDTLRVSLRLLRRQAERGCAAVRVQLLAATEPRAVCTAVLSPG